MTLAQFNGLTANGQNLMRGADEAGWDAGVRAEHSKHTEQHTSFPSEIRGPDRLHYLRELGRWEQGHKGPLGHSEQNGWQMKTTSLVWKMSGGTQLT